MARVLLIWFHGNDRHCLDNEAKTEEPACDEQSRPSLMNSRRAMPSPDSILDDLPPFITDFTHWAMSPFASGRE
jgi:hypothetical protein